MNSPENQIISFGNTFKGKGDNDIRNNGREMPQGDDIELLIL